MMVGTGMRGAMYGARFAAGLRRRQGIRYMAARGAWRGAVGLGKFAYQNRQAIQQTAAKFARKRGRAKKRKRSRAMPSTKNSRVKMTINPPTAGNVIAFSAKRLEIGEITYMEGGIGDNRRNSNQIYVKGIKVCYNFFNRCPYPVELHWALVQFGDEEGLNGPKVRKEFFRDSGEVSNQGRNMDFVEDDTFDRKYLCNPLNPDNKRILSHKKWKIWGEAPANANPEVTGQRRLTTTFDHHLKYEQYHKIQRVVKLNGNQDMENEKPIYKCIWFMPIDPADFTVGDVVEFDEIEKVYWRNVTS